MSAVGPTQRSLRSLSATTFHDARGPSEEQVSISDFCTQI